MTLQRRALIIILITISCIQGSLYLFIDQVLLGEFRKIEESTVRGHVSRVLHAFENNEQQLANKVGDWAAWDDTYEFIVNGNKNYIEETFNFLTLSAMQLRHLVYFDKAGNPKYDNEVFYRQEKVDHIPPATLELLRKAPLALSETQPVSTGSLLLDQSLVLFVTAPIVDSKKEKPARGAILGTIDVNSKMISNIANQTNLSLTAFRVGIDAIGVPEENAIHALQKGESAIIREAGHEMLHGYGLLRDVTGAPALLFRIDNPRSIYHQALNIRDFMLISLGIAGLIWGFLAWVLISKWILRPLTRLSVEMREIASKRMSALRLPSTQKGHSLKLRAAVIMTVTMAILGVAITVIFSTVLTKEFQRIELGEMGDNVERVRRAMDERKADILSKTLDWAQWDDTYQFVVDQNQEYAEANIIHETLAAINMSHVLYYNTKQQLVTGRFVDYDADTFSVLTNKDQEPVEPFTALIKASTEPSTGYVKSGKSLYLAAQSPILDTSREKPTRGYFLFATPINSYFKDTLAKQVQLNLEIILPENEHDFLKDETATESPTVFTRGQSDNVGYLRLNDSNGTHVLTVRVIAPRSAFIQGLEAKKLLTIWLAVVSIVFLAMTLYAIQRWVIARVEKLKLELIEKTAGVYQPSEGTGVEKDELSRLSNDINSMLTALNRAQDELVHAKDAAEAANAAKSTFIAKVSHELRTPIHSIIGMLRIVLKQESNQSRRKHLGMARDAAYALLGTINDILDFSKAEAGMLSVTPVEFGFTETLRETLRTVAPKIYERENIEFLVEVDPKLPQRFIGDPVRLKQILVNLLGNSAKFTNKGYVKLDVTVSETTTEKATLRFGITDTGIGIAEDRISSIFEPFTQADDSAVRRYQGTGLGLTIVKQLVETMGGKVSVTSQMGKGSVFTAEIPFGLVSGDTKISQNTLLRGRTVVVLDHSPERRNSLQRLFVQAGATEVRSHPSLELPTGSILVASGEMLEQSQHWAYLEKFLDQHGADSVVTLHTPSQLTLRERLGDLGVTKMLIRPAVPSDILESIQGEGVVTLDEDEQMHDQTPKLPKLKVLIADDTPTNQIILQDMLEEAGHEVTTVLNGQELLDKVIGAISSGAKSPFDIVLSDVQMPQMDGVSAAKIIRDTEKTSSKFHLPIIMVTAHAFPEEKQRILQAGADDVVTKPIEPNDLWKKIERVISESSTTSFAPQSQTMIETITHPFLSPEEELLQVTARILAEKGGECTQILDIDDLLRRTGKSARRARRILDAYLQGHSGLVGLLRAGKEARNAEALRRAAHALKGTLLDTGAGKVAAIAARIENLSAEGKLDEALALCEELERGTESVSEVTQQILGEISA